MNTTNPETEAGEDIDVDTWLSTNKLCNLQKLFEQLSVTIEEIYHFNDEELNSFSADHDMDILTKNRFKRAVKINRPSPKKDVNSIEPMIKPLVVTAEEHIAINKLYDKYETASNVIKSIQNGIPNIQKTVDELNNNTIDREMDEIIAQIKTHQTRILQGIDSITKQKQEILSIELKEMEQYQIEVQNIRIECQNMLKLDTGNANSSNINDLKSNFTNLQLKRRTKSITKKSAQILQKYAITASSLPIVCPSIRFKLNEKLLKYFVSDLKLNTCDQPIITNITCDKVTFNSVGILFECDNVKIKEISKYEVSVVATPKSEDISKCDWQWLWNQNNKNNNNASQSTTVREIYKQRLMCIYMIHDPKKSERVHALVEKHADGRLHDLYLKICDKYKVNPDNQVTDMTLSQQKLQKPAVFQFGGKNGYDNEIAFGDAQTWQKACRDGKTNNNNSGFGGFSINTNNSGFGNQNTNSGFGNSFGGTTWGNSNSNNNNNSNNNSTKPVTSSSSGFGWESKTTTNTSTGSFSWGASSSPNSGFSQWGGGMQQKKKMRTSEDLSEDLSKLTWSFGANSNTNANDNDKKNAQSASKTDNNDEKDKENEETTADSDAEMPVIVWKTQKVHSSQIIETIEHTKQCNLVNLSQNCDYKLKLRCKGKRGWSAFSNVIEFATLRQPGAVCLKLEFVSCRGYFQENIQNSSSFGNNNINGDSPFAFGGNNCFGRNNFGNVSGTQVTKQFHPKNMIDTWNGGNYASKQVADFEKDECDWVIFKIVGTDFAGKKCSYSVTKVDIGNVSTYQSVKEFQIQIGDKSSSKTKRLQKSKKYLKKIKKQKKIKWQALDDNDTYYQNGWISTRPLTMQTSMRSGTQSFDLKHKLVSNRKLNYIKFSFLRNHIMAVNSHADSALFYMNGGNYHNSCKFTVSNVSVYGIPIQPK